MKSIELFAGIGGIALAAEWAGIETVAFCERDTFCQKVLNKHWPNVPIFEDIFTLNRQVLEEQGVIEPDGTVDIVSGGFPCQPYSTAGSQKGREDDRDLWPEMFRIIQELKPTWVIGENVANFVNMELERTCSDLEREGYETQTFVIPACSVDAKHQRYRTFVVAHTSSIGLQRQRESIKSFNPKENRKREASEPLNVCESSEWAAEPGVGRVAHGIPNRMDRLRGLGNAVVPQQIYPIFKAIMELN